MKIPTPGKDISCRSPKRRHERSEGTIAICSTVFWKKCQDPEHGAGASSWSADRVDVWATGRDGRTWHRWWDGSRWVEWEQLD